MRMNDHPWHQLPPRRRNSTRNADSLKRAGLISLVAFLLIALLAGICLSAESNKAITGPDKLDVGGWDFFEAATDAKSLKWVVFPTTGAKWRALENGRVVIFGASKAGTYTLILATAKGDVPSLYAHEVTVGTSPNPPLPPDPVDPPEPASKQQVAIVYESSATTGLTKDQRSILAGLTFRQELAKRGHVWVGLLEISQRANATKATDPYYVAAEADKSLPCVTVAPIAGGSVRAFPLPKTEAEFWDKLEGSKR